MGVIGKRVIPAELLAPIAAWAAENHETHFNNVHAPDRWITVLPKWKGVYPDEIDRVRDLAFDHFGVARGAHSKQAPDFFNYHTGGAVHFHRDGLPGHKRINVMVSKPEVGGNPVIAGAEIAVEDGDVWLCDAARDLHGSTTMGGARPRIVLSFGFDGGA